MLGRISLQTSRWHSFPRAVFPILSKPRFFRTLPHVKIDSGVEPAHIPKVLSPVVKGAQASATLAVNADSKEMIARGRKIFKFGFGQSPFPVPECLVEALQEHAHHKEYLPGLGLQELREAVTDWTNHEYNLKRGPNTVMVGPGTKELLFLIQFCFDGDLLLHVGSWVSYAPHAQLTSTDYTYIPTTFENQFKLQAEDLDEYCRTHTEKPHLLVLNYPANPTGATYSIDELKQLAKVAREHNVLVVADEIYAHITFDKDHASIAEYYPEGTVILTGLSKWAAAGGWRLGMFSFPDELKWLMDAMANVASETFSCVAAPIQYAGVRAFQKDCPYITKFLDDQLDVLRVVADYCTRTLRNTSTKVHRSRGAFYIFPDFSETEAGKSLLRSHSKGLFDGPLTSNSSEPDIDEIFRKDLLEKTGVALLAGHHFGVERGSLMFRLSYVDFDGRNAMLDAPRYLSDREADKWVAEYCPNIDEGMQVLVEYLNNQQF